MKVWFESDIVHTNLMQDVETYYLVVSTDKAVVDFVTRVLVKQPLLHCILNRHLRATHLTDGNLVSAIY